MNLPRRSSQHTAAHPVECDLQVDYYDQYRRDHAEAGKEARRGRQGSMQRQISGHTVADKGGHSQPSIRNNTLIQGNLRLPFCSRISRHFEVAKKVVAVHCSLLS